MTNIYNDIFYDERASVEQRADKLKGFLHHAQNLTFDMLAVIHGERAHDDLDVDALSERILQIEDDAIRHYQRYVIASSAAGIPSLKRAEIVTAVMDRLFDVHERLEVSLRSRNAQTTGYAL
jgi:hypothetical protein